MKPERWLSNTSRPMTRLTHDIWNLQLRSANFIRLANAHDSPVPICQAEETLKDVESTKQELEMAKADLDNANTGLLKAQSDFEELKGRLEASQVETFNAQEEASTAKEALAAAREELDTLRNQMGDTTTSIASLTLQVTELSEYKFKAEEYQNKIFELNETVVEAADKLVEAEMEVLELREEKEESLETQEKNLAQIKALEADIARALEKHVAQVDELQEFEKGIALLTLQLKATQEDLAKSKAALAAAQSQIEVQISEIQHLTQEAESAKRAVSSNSEKDVQIEGLLKLHEAHSVKLAEIEASSAKVTEILRKEVEELRDECAELKGQLSSMNLALQYLDDEKTELEEEVER
jgi:conserved oligomeric Golgi complex subunit 6